MSNRPLTSERRRFDSHHIAPSPCFHKQSPHIPSTLCRLSTIAEVDNSIIMLHCTRFNKAHSKPMIIAITRRNVLSAVHPADDGQRRRVSHHADAEDKEEDVERPVPEA